MKKILLIIAVIFCPITIVFASPWHCSTRVFLNGIYYEISDCDEAYTVNGMGMKYDGPIVTVIPKYEDAVAVKNCYKGDVVIPSKITYQGREMKVRKIATHTFYGCKELRSLSIPYTVYNIENRAIVDCPKLTHVSWEPSRITNFGCDNFLDCPNVQDTLIICDTIFIHLPVSFEGQYIMPNKIKEIGTSAFMDCSKLSSIMLSENVHTIRENAFKNCVALDSLDLPENLQYIGDRAFYNCSKLTTITIPYNVRFTGKGILFNCEQLRNAIVATRNNNFDGILFDTNPNLSTIVIPSDRDYSFLRRGDHNGKIVTKPRYQIQQAIDDRNKMLKENREREEARIKREATQKFIASLVKCRDCIQATYRVYKSGIMFDVPVNKKMNINLYSTDETLEGELFWIINDSEYIKFSLDNNRTFPGFTHRANYDGGYVLININKLTPCK